MEKEQIIINNHNEGLVEIGMVLQRLLHNSEITIQNQNKIMKEVDDLNGKVDELQATVDAVQEKIAARILTDDEVIADLKAQLADSPAPEAIQAIIDKVEAAKTDLAATPTV